MVIHATIGEDFVGRRIGTHRGVELGTNGRVRGMILHEEQEGQVRLQVIVWEQGEVVPLLDAVKEVGGGISCRSNFSVFSLSYIIDP